MDRNLVWGTLKARVLVLLFWINTLIAFNLLTKKVLELS